MDSKLIPDAKEAPIYKQSKFRNLATSEAEDILMNEAITAPAFIDSLSALLKYGPTGLAALMLILVVIALSLGIVTPSRERLLTRFMYVGAACFAMSLLANFFAVAGHYPLHFRVIPIDAGSSHILPLPIITANSTRLDEKMTYLVKSEVTAIVDVTDALDFVQEVRSQSDRQRQILSSIASGSDALLADLQRVPKILDKNCSGGAHGVPAASNPAIIEIATRAASKIAVSKASAIAEISSKTPQLK